MRNQNKRVACAPFAGLGFDLSGVIRTAGFMLLVRVQGSKPRMDRPEATAQDWGYGLMLALNRETMGS